MKVKTSISLDAAVLQALKDLAAADERSTSYLIEKWITEKLDAMAPASPVAPHEPGKIIDPAAVGGAGTAQERYLARDARAM